MNPLFDELKTVRGLDSVPLRPYVQPYIKHLREQGYRPRTVRAHLCLFANFGRWLTRTDRRLRDLNEELVAQFLGRHLGGRTWQAGERPALQRLLGILRKARVTPPAKAISTTPAQRLAADYRRYLSEERGCSGWTLENYGRHIDRFVTQRFGAGPLKPSRLQAQDVVAFVKRNASEHGRGHTLQVVTASRSFLRFLRYRGRIASDLAAAVPAGGPLANGRSAQASSDRGSTEGARRL